MRYFSFIIGLGICLSLGVVSSAILAVPPPECEVDADCDDGFFCTGAESCESGTCAAVSACPPAVEGCLVLNAICDEENDTCIDEPDDSLCPEGYFCTLDGNCVPDEEAACREAQLEAQSTVQVGNPYKNHGQMVRTAANLVSEYEHAGMITEECSSCIMSQFGRDIPIFPSCDDASLPYQEACGELAVCPISLSDWFDAGPDDSFTCLGFGYESSFGLLKNWHVIPPEQTFSIWNQDLCMPGRYVPWLEDDVLGPGLSALCFVDGCREWFMPITPTELQLCESEFLEYMDYLEAEGTLFRGQGCPE
jgi:hypothetical protein